MQAGLESHQTACSALYNQSLQKLTGMTGQIGMPLGTLQLRWGQVARDRRTSLCTAAQGILIGNIA